MKRSSRSSHLYRAAACSQSDNPSRARRPAKRKDSITKERMEEDLQSLVKGMIHKNAPGELNV